MEPVRAKRDFRKEFMELGREQVRSDLLYRRYSGEKAIAARIWLEQADALDWQNSHVPRDKKSLLRNEKLLKAIPYIGAGALILFTLARWLR
jgi:hypothetical protein